MDREALVKEYVQTGQPILRNQIVKSFNPLVKHVADQFNLIYSTTLTRDDLYQAGVVGLLIALDRYKLKSDTPFESFAYKRIYGEVVDTLRKEGLIGRNKYNQIKKLDLAIQSLSSKLAYIPSPGEVCNYLDISEDTYHSLRGIAQKTYTISLNTNILYEGGEYISHVDNLEDEDQSTPEETTIKADLKHNLKKIINDLPDRQKLIMALYYYERMNLADIARMMELTEARISQILKQTHLEIRNSLEV